MSEPIKKKKISRKEIIHLSTAETWQLTKETVFKLGRYMKPFKGRFILGVLLGIIGGAFNMIMLLSFQLIFSIVLKGETKAFGEGAELPIVGKVSLAKWFPLDDGEVSLWGLAFCCALIPFLIFMRGMFQYLANYCMLWVGNKVLLRLRSDVFSRLLQQSLGFFNQSKTGDLIQTVFNQTRVAQTNAVSLAQVLVNRPVTILFLLIGLYAMDPFFTTMSLVVFPLCILPVIQIGKRVRRAGSNEETQAGALMSVMHESFVGIRVVKSHAREDYELKRFNRANKSMLDSVMRWSKAAEIVGPIVETVASLAIAGGLYYAYQTRGTPNEIGADKFFILVIALTQIYPPAKDLSKIQILLQKAIVATTNVFNILEREPDVKDAEDAVPLKQAKGAVSFKNVGFHYSDPKGKKLDRAAVTDVTLDLEPGKFYALVGPSGAGKSTLFSLLLRFYDPDSGHIEVDGIPIKQIKQESLRDNIGVVSQDTFLFHDTILENIRYGRLDATDEEVIAAAKKAHVHDFVMDIQGQYEAVVGDSGCNLSGGQKQRVSIARAILRNAPILLLDEATSALDTESEKIIQEAIHLLSEGKTVIAIAHRLSTILEADQIVVMQEGKVEGLGAHHELLKTSELYQRLYHLQYKETAEQMAAMGV
jgi:ATP-binding cassette, subfamily B, bacterial MsbA